MRARRVEEQVRKERDHQDRRHVDRAVVRAYRGREQRKAQSRDEQSFDELRDAHDHRAGKAGLHGGGDNRLGLGAQFGVTSRALAGDVVADGLLGIESEHSVRFGVGGLGLAEI